MQKVESKKKAAKEKGPSAAERQAIQAEAQDEDDSDEVDLNQMGGQDGEEGELEMDEEHWIYIDE